MHTTPSTHTLPFVVGVDLGGTQVRVAVLQGATLLSRVDLLTGENPLPDRLFPRIYDAIQQACEQAGTRTEQIAGIGIGSPGPLNGESGIVFDPPNLPGWHNVPLRDLFARHHDLPVVVENDANTAALGEYLFGAGRGSQNMVYLTISTGIGGGVILDGKILRGVSGTAAELGHITIDRHGDRCNCGNIGCLESIASGTAIARHAKELMAEDADFLHWVQEKWLCQRAEMEPKAESEAPAWNTFVDARLIGEAAAEGIPGACEIMRNAADALGIGLINVLHIFNPELIILGGGVTQAGSLLIEPALRIVQERAMKVPRDAVRIVQAHLGTDVGLVGAGALIYHSTAPTSA